MKILSWGGATFFLAYFFGGAIFFNALFLLTFFFHESDITCIITVVGAQQQHKGMFFLNMEVRGGQIFPTVSWGAMFFPCILEGGRFIFRLSILPNHPPAINNERSLTYVDCVLQMCAYDMTAQSISY